MYSVVILVFFVKLFRPLIGI